jgi:hypothetical protein
MAQHVDFHYKSLGSLFRFGTKSEAHMEASVMIAIIRTAPSG